MNSPAPRVPRVAASSDTGAFGIASRSSRQPQKRRLKPSAAARGQPLNHRDELKNFRIYRSILIILNTLCFYNVFYDIILFMSPITVPLFT